MSCRSKRTFDRGLVVQVRRVLLVTLGTLALGVQAQSGAAVPGGSAQGEVRNGEQAPKKTSIQALFVRVDENGDGKLSRDEAVRLPAISARFDEFDVDADGALSLPEFQAGAVAPVR
ncbi:EF-hand domain-containing protein [Caldimonas brevitalea]|uniref:EF-hand domain-containing protein n=1 Tax=Caldimonas brevitalea TaxID=413882 RepID=A0A0G3C0B8_9BURK|nr:EF-hand domain-containing protein [Caldimonas brevitalea]AKJ32225.1 hypothetical protein AAW51_5534 [Caldimonas brevitalea]